MHSWAIFMNHFRAGGFRTGCLLYFFFFLLRGFKFSYLFFRFLLTVWRSRFVVMFEFGICFDIFFDDFDQTFFEERVVVLNPGRKRIFCLKLICWLIMTCFPQEKSYQMKYFFQKGSGCHVIVETIILTQLYIPKIL